MDNLRQDLTNPETQTLLGEIADRLARIEAKLDAGQRVGSLTIQATEFCTIKEAAEMLGFNPKTIRRMIEKGELRHSTLPGGTHKRLLRADVQRLLRKAPDHLAR